MRNVVRTIMTLGALTAMLGGLLGQGSVPAGAAKTPRIDRASIQVSVATRPMPGEDPLPRWAYAARVTPRIATNPDPKHPFGDTIEVSIADQRLTAWRNGVIVYKFKISTAKPGYNTPKGHFKIKLKARRYWSRQWQVWMPDALLFHGSYFIHSLPYASDPNARLGANRLGFADSHGCVRVGIEDSKLLYEWASVGTPVWVH